MGATARPAYRTGEETYAERSSAAARPGGDGIALTETVPQDLRLLRAVQRGDREAFTLVVKHHQQAVYGYLRARLTQPADAEDLCQEVFLRCYSGKVKFQRATQLRPWLIGIARNVLREHVRKLVRSKEVAWTELCLELDSLNQEEEPAHAEAMHHLPDCLESLGTSAREAINLRYASDLRLTDIGQQLHRSEGAIKLLIFRARQALRQCLQFKLRRSG